MRDRTILSKLLVLLVAIGSSLSLVTKIPYAQGSTDEGGGDEGDVRDSNKGDNTEEDGGGSDEEGGASTPVTPTEPSAEEEANDSDNDDSSNEPLPYCDSPRANEGGSCHDIDDIDEETGKFPCNDGTQRANKADCPDATKPVLPVHPKTPLSRTTTIFATTYSIQGSGLPEQTGPIPIPKPGEAVLEIFYDDEWTGNVLDSNNTSVSYDGDGDYSIVFPCAEEDDFNLPGFYSLTVQKGDDDDEIMQLVQNHLNQTLKQGQTSAEFGVVSLSGECVLS